MGKTTGMGTGDSQCQEATGNCLFRYNINKGLSNEDTNLSSNIYIDYNYKKFNGVVVYGNNVSYGTQEGNNDKNKDHALSGNILNMTTGKISASGVTFYDVKYNHSFEGDDGIETTGIEAIAKLSVDYFINLKYRIFLGNVLEGNFNQSSENTINNNELNFGNGNTSVGYGLDGSIIGNMATNIGTEIKISSNKVFFNMDLDDELTPGAFEFYDQAHTDLSSETIKAELITNDFTKIVSSNLLSDNITFQSYLSGSVANAVLYNTIGNMTNNVITIENLRLDEFPTTLSSDNPSEDATVDYPNTVRTHELKKIFYMNDDGENVSDEKYGRSGLFGAYFFLTETKIGDGRTTEIRINENGVEIGGKLKTAMKTNIYGAVADKYGEGVSLEGFLINMKGNYVKISEDFLSDAGYILVESDKITSEVAGAAAFVNVKNTTNVVNNSVLISSNYVTVMANIGYSGGPKIEIMGVRAENINTNTASVEENYIQFDGSSKNIYSVNFAVKAKDVANIKKNYVHIYGGSFYGETYGVFLEDILHAGNDKFNSKIAENEILIGRNNIADNNIAFKSDIIGVFYKSFYDAHSTNNNILIEKNKISIKDANNQAITIDQTTYGIKIVKEDNHWIDIGEAEISNNSINIDLTHSFSKISKNIYGIYIYDSMATFENGYSSIEKLRIANNKLNLDSGIFDISGNGGGLFNVYVQYSSPSNGVKTTSLNVSDNIFSISNGVSIDDSSLTTLPSSLYNVFLGGSFMSTSNVKTISGNKFNLDNINNNQMPITIKANNLSNVYMDSSFQASNAEILLNIFNINGDNSNNGSINVTVDDLHNIYIKSNIQNALISQNTFSVSGNAELVAKDIGNVYYDGSVTNVAGGASFLQNAFDFSFQDDNVFLRVDDNDAKVIARNVFIDGINSAEIISEIAGNNMTLSSGNFENFKNVSFYNIDNNMGITNLIDNTLKLSSDNGALVLSSLFIKNLVNVNQKNVEVENFSGNITNIEDNESNSVIIQGDDNTAPIYITNIFLDVAAGAEFDYANANNSANSFNITFSNAFSKVGRAILKNFYANENVAKGKVGYLTMNISGGIFNNVGIYAADNVNSVTHSNIELSNLTIEDSFLRILEDSGESKDSEKKSENNTIKINNSGVYRTDIFAANGKENGYGYAAADNDSIIISGNNLFQGGSAKVENLTVANMENELANLSIGDFINKINIEFLSGDRNFLYVGGNTTSNVGSNNSNKLIMRGDDSDPTRTTFNILTGYDIVISKMQSSDNSYGNILEIENTKNYLTDITITVSENEQNSYGNTLTITNSWLLGKELNQKIQDFIFSRSALEKSYNNTVKITGSSVYNLNEFTLNDSLENEAHSNNISITDSDIKNINTFTVVRGAKDVYNNSFTMGNSSIEKINMTLWMIFKSAAGNLYGNAIAIENSSIAGNYNPNNANAPISAEAIFFTTISRVVNLDNGEIDGHSHDNIFTLSGASTIENFTTLTIVDSAVESHSNIIKI
ncbi:MAG: hypothetical protein LBB09_02205, partial [Rickettsiales bacterium]|nr:hypothetical protein [Rickettsiales bacterium]